MDSPSSLAVPVPPSQPASKATRSNKRPWRKQRARAQTTSLGVKREPTPPSPASQQGSSHEDTGFSCSGDLLEKTLEKTPHLARLLAGCKKLPRRSRRRDTDHELYNEGGKRMTSEEIRREKRRRTNRESAKHVRKVRAVEEAGTRREVAALLRDNMQLRRELTSINADFKDMCEQAVAWKSLWHTAASTSQSLLKRMAYYERMPQDADMLQTLMCSSSDNSSNSSTANTLVGTVPLTSMHLPEQQDPLTLPPLPTAINLTNPLLPHAGGVDLLCSSPMLIPQLGTGASTPLDLADAPMFSTPGLSQHTHLGPLAGPNCGMGFPSNSAALTWPLCV